MASKVKIALGVVGGAVGLAGLALGGGWLWATSASNAKLDVVYETHQADFPIPFPLSGTEIEALRAERAAQVTVDPSASTTLVAIDAAMTATPPDPLTGVDLEAVALERAVARGKHLVESRYGCSECHGHDFGGGTMMDVPAIAVLKGPNLTMGHGSATATFTAADWDRAVRHGVSTQGKPLAMPAEDFRLMSDRELSDVIAYIRSLPPVDAEAPVRTLGPVGRVLMATGQLPLSAEKHPDHHAPHAAEAPPEAPTAEFGAHVANVCTGCHERDFRGGKMAGGDPSWPEVANITPHADGLGGWTYEDFDRLMRTGVRKDGTTVVLPMASVIPYSAKMTETEMQALWTYLQTVEPKPDAG